MGSLRSEVPRLQSGCPQRREMAAYGTDIQTVLKFDCRDIHQSVDNGIDSESGRTVYLQLACYIAAMSDDGVD